MPTSLNQRIIDRSISHATFLRRLQNGEANRIVRLLHEAVHEPLTRRLASRLDRIKTRGFDTGPRTTQRIAETLTRNSELIRLGMGEVYPELRSALTDVGFMEASFQTRMIRDSFPRALEFDLTRPSGQLLRSAVTARPFNGRVLRTWWQSVNVGAREGVNGAVVQGLARGETVSEMMRGVRSALATTSRNAESVVRTAVNHVTQHAREETYRTNTDVVQQVRYIATLDARTTDTCASLDGRVFDIGDGPRPPMHFNCRSTTVPVVKPFSELGIPGLKDLPEAQRSSIDGPVSVRETYGTWLRRQPVAEQNRVLGVGRAKLFRDGKVPIDRFVDSQYQPLTLEQVLKREGLTRADLN
jgi:SPP1 gp7 family putative phage head morphogenesis protein